MMVRDGLEAARAMHGPEAVNSEAFVNDEDVTALLEADHD